MIEFTFRPDDASPPPTARTGCVLTITGNWDTTKNASDSTVAVPGYGQSTRIVSVDPTATNGTFYVTAFPDGSIPAPSGNVQVKFIINGVPFTVRCFVTVAAPEG